MDKSKIKMLINALPMSEKKLAKMIGISEKTLQRIKHEVRYQPSLATKAKIRRYFKNMVKNIDRIIKEN